MARSPVVALCQKLEMIGPHARTDGAYFVDFESAWNRPKHAPPDNSMAVVGSLDRGVVQPPVLAATVNDARPHEALTQRTVIARPSLFDPLQHISAHALTQIVGADWRPWLVRCSGGELRCPAGKARRNGASSVFGYRPRLNSIPLRDAGLASVDCYWLGAGHAIYGGYRDISAAHPQLVFGAALAVATRHAAP
jgi:hypothetical protein